MLTAGQGATRAPPPPPTRLGAVYSGSADTVQRNLRLQVRISTARRRRVGASARINGGALTIFYAAPLRATPLSPWVGDPRRRQSGVLIRHLGVGSAELLAFIRECPVGADTLVLRVLVDLAEIAKPSRELVEAARHAYTTRELPSRFLIPVLSGFTKVRTGLSVGNIRRRPADQRVPVAGRKT